MKSETRMPKPEGNPNEKTQVMIATRSRKARFGFRPSDFGILSDLPSP